MEKMDELKAKVMVEAGIVDVDAESIAAAERCDYLTVNTGRDGREYVWYFDGKYEACADAETGEFITKEKISALFC